MPSSLNGGGSRSSSSSTAMGVPPRADAISVPAMGSSVDMRGSGRGEVGRPRTGQSHILGEAKRSRVERGRAAALDGAIDDPRGGIVGRWSEGWESGGFGSRRGVPVERVCAFGKCGERRASLDNARGWFLGISEP